MRKKRIFSRGFKGANSGWHMGAAFSKNASEYQIQMRAFYLTNEIAKGLLE